MLSLCLTVLVSVSSTPCLKAKAAAIAVQYGLDSNTFVALITTESNWKVNAYNAKTRDYGLSQINEKTIVALHLNRKRLLTDPDYALHSGARTLVWFKRNYHHEAKWLCRYNVGTGKLVGRRLDACNSYYLKVVKNIKVSQPLSIVRN